MSPKTRSTIRRLKERGITVVAVEVSVALNARLGRIAKARGLSKSQIIRDGTSAQLDALETK
jgi:predicted transcriptional regulator